MTVFDTLIEQAENATERYRLGVLRDTGVNGLPLAAVLCALNDEVGKLCLDLASPIDGMTQRIPLGVFFAAAARGLTSEPLP
jgi:hypothetical protein